MRAAITTLAQHLSLHYNADRIAAALGKRLAQLLGALPVSPGDNPLQRAAVALLVLGPARARGIFDETPILKATWPGAVDSAPAVWLAWTGDEASPPAAIAASPNAAAAAAASALALPRSPGPAVARAPDDDDDVDEVVIEDGPSFLRGLGHAFDRRLDQRVPPMAHAAAAAHAHAARCAAAADTQSALRQAAPALASAAAAHAAEHARHALHQAGPEVVGLCQAAAAHHAHATAQQLAARVDAQHAALRDELASRLDRLEERLVARTAARAAFHPPPLPIGRPAWGAPAPGRFGEGAGDTDDEAAPARGGARAAAAARARAAAWLADDDDGSSDGDVGDDLRDVLRSVRRRRDARPPASGGLALWDVAVLLQGEPTLRVWAAHGVGEDAHATATLLTTWRTAVEAALPSKLQGAAASAVANAIALLADGGDLSGSLARRLAIDITFYAVAARYGVAVGSDVAAAMRGSDSIPAPMRRLIQAARRTDGYGAGNMVLGDRDPTAAEVEATALLRDTEPSHPRYGADAGRGRGRGRGGRGGQRAAAQSRPAQRQPSPQRQQPQQQAQPRQDRHQQQQQGNGGRGRGQA